MNWATVEDCILHRSKGHILWEVGDYEFTLRGGMQRVSGDRSTLSVRSIISVDGAVIKDPKSITTVSRRKLFGRDRHTCAYCGQTYGNDDLSMDHIVPSSRGGANSWMNLVTACIWCNQKKNDLTPEEARMPLLYVPYVPNRYEAMILMNRKILSDQMDFLIRKVPKHSRLL